MSRLQSRDADELPCFNHPACVGKLDLAVRPFPTCMTCGSYACPACQGELEDRTGQPGAGAWTCKCCDESFCANCQREIELRTSHVTGFCTWICTACRAGVPSVSGSVRGIYSVRRALSDSVYFDWPWLPEEPKDCDLLAVVRLPDRAQTASFVRGPTGVEVVDLLTFEPDMARLKILVVDDVGYSAEQVLRGEGPDTVPVLWRRRPMPESDGPCFDCGEEFQGESPLGRCWSCRMERPEVSTVRGIYVHRQENDAKILDAAGFSDLPEDYDLTAVVRFPDDVRFFVDGPSDAYMKSAFEWDGAFHYVSQVLWGEVPDVEFLWKA